MVMVISVDELIDINVTGVCKVGQGHRAPVHAKQEQEVSKAHIPRTVAIRGCNTFREKTKLSKIS